MGKMGDGPIKLERTLPREIEERSFEIIEEELGGRVLDPVKAPIIKRVIHATADFDYVDNLCFTENAVERMQDALRHGACIVTDTQMALAGINKRKLTQWGGEAHCFMGDEDVAASAQKNGTTRAVASMDKAIRLYADKEKPLLFVIGNAPTALVRLYEWMREGKEKPAGIIGAPVGFVNVVEAKELILGCDCASIVAKGRKGGSSVAVAILNALLYSL